MPNRFRRELLMSIVIIAGSTALSGAALYFLSGKLQAAADDILLERINIAQSSTHLAELAELKRSSQDAERYRIAIEKFLAPQDQLIEFPGWLDGVARAHGADLRFSFSSPEVHPQADALGHIGFSIETTGTFDALTSFFKEVESQAQRFFLSVDTITLTKGGLEYVGASKGRVFFK